MAEPSIFLTQVPAELLELSIRDDLGALIKRSYKMVIKNAKENLKFSTFVRFLGHFSKISVFEK